MPEQNPDYGWERPPWVKATRDFLADKVIEHLADDGSEDDISDEVTKAAMAVICGHYGHWVEQDQCMNPDHRYCIWCGRNFPRVEPGQFSEASQIDGSGSV